MGRETGGRARPLRGYPPAGRDRAEGEGEMKLGYGIKPWTPEEEERLKSLISARLRPMKSRSSCTALFKQFTGGLMSCACLSSGLKSFARFASTAQRRRASPDGRKTIPH